MTCEGQEVQFQGAVGSDTSSRVGSDSVGCEIYSTVLSLQAQKNPVILLQQQTWLMMTPAHFCLPYCPAAPTTTQWSLWSLDLLT